MTSLPHVFGCEWRSATVGLLLETVPLSAAGHRGTADLLVRAALQTIALQELRAELLIGSDRIIHDYALRGVPLSAAPDDRT